MPSPRVRLMLIQRRIWWASINIRLDGLHTQPGPSSFEINTVEVYGLLFKKANEGKYRVSTKHVIHVLHSLKSPHFPVSRLAASKALWSR